VHVVSQLNGILWLSANCQDIDGDLVGTLQSTLAELDVICLCNQNFYTSWKALCTEVVRGAMAIAKPFKINGNLLKSNGQGIQNQRKSLKSKGQGLQNQWK